METAVKEGFWPSDMWISCASRDHKLMNNSSSKMRAVFHPCCAERKICLKENSLNF